MMKGLILLGLLGLSLAHLEVIEDKSWHLWKGVHNKYYPNMFVEKIRYNIWQDNSNRIENFNKLNQGYSLRMNHFGDLTNTEYRQHMNGYKMRSTKHSEAATFLSPTNVKVPDTVDWRQQGFVTPVKNQGQCGSCWAFSTTGSLEGQHFKKTGKLVSLSEQNLVDCSSKEGNMGCNGGLMDQAFAYIKTNGGIDTEESYPYKGADGQCKFDAKNIGANDTGFVDVKSGDEDALKTAVSTVGPISVAIDASHFSFQFYHSGVYNSWLCSSTRLDHGVLAIGYGTYQGKDYWLVKNSWGTGWGLKGYIMMSRNKKNQCGIATQASYPLVTGSLEGQHFKKTGKLVSLSEQNLVDCSSKEGNMGCNGGLMDQAFAYIKTNGGIDTEESYPYKGADGQCKFDAKNIGANDTGFVDVKSGDEDALKTAVATVGPISVAIDASHFSFQFYHSGVYNSWLCSSTRLDHGVLAIGYGTYQGKDYWIVKNSWGTGWGLKGYIMMSRNKKNQCGIATQASYPLV
ncbi:cathepsin L-like [Clytia hemisphaerica]